MTPVFSNGTAKSSFVATPPTTTVKRSLKNIRNVFRYGLPEIKEGEREIAPWMASLRHQQQKTLKDRGIDTMLEDARKNSKENDEHHMKRSYVPRLPDGTLEFT
ncbi:hypothetical protein CPC735_045790 [Coccidioides posadasii C735 delta SOWgp]|uniref:Uncharacterized protein n=3 Tax=Coccidioides posadasii TaxID=199306 RepID=E9DA05_COCPS|nr:hypothetical protein CPC735_045790 [Coccidioides posadasii C735 delta SOWgp]EER23209.1 hypothetical protein CPC735_045790 [Coccidioides posadasii C735 delta SOWgp]EFW16736.1 conserved hypothetical protein [Coccidioides posadasii str. Silveira]KMM64502.1 hypothetical protein CPAG_00854 [Coccidioides posadasii RMSCC 3488]|eukprot:XP_003065354.1 hypothetical protein CPC735_045790 [Coccidioides posadasii C735 delta SOWgp]